MSRFLVHVSNGKAYDYLKKGGHGLSEDTAYMFATQDEAEDAIEYAEENGVFDPEEFEAQIVEIG